MRKTVFEKRLCIFVVLLLFFGVYYSSCVSAKLNTKQGLTSKKALKVLTEEAKKKGLTLIKNKFSFSSEGNKSIAHALVIEPKESDFKKGVPVSLILVDNLFLTRDGKSRIDPGIYVLKFQTTDFARKIGRFSVTLILEGNNREYSFDYELEIVSLGGSDELPKDYLVSAGFCEISLDKQFKFIAFDWRRYLYACNCCIKPPPPGECDWGPPADSDCNFAILTNP